MKKCSDEKRIKELKEKLLKKKGLEIVLKRLDKAEKELSKLKAIFRK